MLRWKSWAYKVQRCLAVFIVHILRLDMSNEKREVERTSFYALYLFRGPDKCLTEGFISPLHNECQTIVLSSGLSLELFPAIVLNLSIARRTGSSWTPFEL